MSAQSIKVTQTGLSLFRAVRIAAAQIERPFSAEEEDCGFILKVDETKAASEIRVRGFRALVSHYGFGSINTVTFTQLNGDKLEKSEYKVVPFSIGGTNLAVFHNYNLHWTKVYTFELLVRGYSYEQAVHLMTYFFPDFPKVSWEESTGMWVLDWTLTDLVWDSGTKLSFRFHNKDRSQFTGTLAGETYRMSLTSRDGWLKV